MHVKYRTKSTHTQFPAEITHAGSFDIFQKKIIIDVCVLSALACNRYGFNISSFNMHTWTIATTRLLWISYLSDWLCIHIPNVYSNNTWVFFNYRIVSKCIGNCSKIVVQLWFNTLLLNVMSFDKRLINTLSCKWCIHDDFPHEHFRQQ